MKVFEKKLYEELRDFEREMKSKLDRNLVDERIKCFVEAELKDIQVTLCKIEDGQFGRCEMSGELIPFDLLSFVPTAKTFNDFKKIKAFYKIPHSYK
ncbi:TraR/DksA family transcriptional regulator [Bacillus sp. CGMCC 1.16607]|uniref:TraR/DksA family transcriptional regulator n=1 Tax=Bacillus sp. CGMCC 1.16607 TaxID=3351842 RepID=UPI0036296D78